MRLGTHDLFATSGSYQDVKVIHAVEHPEFKISRRAADIAILYLEHDVKFTGKFKF